MKIEHVAAGSAMLLAALSAPLAGHPGHHAETLGSAGGWAHYVTQPDHAGVVLLVCVAVLLVAGVTAKARGALLR